MIQREDMRGVLLVAYAMLVHHDLLHFGGFSPATISSIFSDYARYFDRCLADDDPESWLSRAAFWKRQFHQLDAKYRAADAPRQHVINVAHRGYVFRCVANYSFNRSLLKPWQETTRVAFIAREPPPRTDDRDTGRHGAPEELIESLGKRVGDRVMHKGACSGAGGDSCSQINGPLDNYLRGTVARYNTEHAELLNRRAAARVRMERALEGVAMLRRAQEFATALANDPMVHPPVVPTRP